MEQRKPTIGLVGIMQALYDEMLPGITERQAGYAREIARQLSDVADVRFSKPIKSRADVEEVVREYARQEVDGLMLVNLTFGPAMRITRAFMDTKRPLLLANTQPECNITDRWDMGDMTYNQGIHGIQDTANTLVRMGKRFAVITGHWRSESFKKQFADWAHAARAATAWRKLRIAIFGYSMNGMGDIRMDETAMMRHLGPEINFLAQGDLYRAMQEAGVEEIKAVIERENRLFEIDDNLSQEQREESARYQVALRRLLEAGGYGAYSTHFDAIGEDGRFRFLPLAAASNLLAEGYGFGAEGDAASAALVSAGHHLIGDAHFTEMYAMDFDRGTVLMSHMGEGNWKLAREDEPVRLIDRELGIGGLERPPTILFRLRPGPATLTSLVAVGGEHFRLVVSEGQIIEDAPLMPVLEMPYGEYRPDTGLGNCLDGWLRAGGTHHQCMNLGCWAERWRQFCEIAGIDYVRV